jgi:hypothetical protein
MKRYLIDKLADGLVESAVAAIAKATKGSKKPIQSVVMWRDSSETFIPYTALISFTPGKPQGYARSDLQVTFIPPRTEVPSSLFSIEEKPDPVRDAFIKANALDKKADWWSQALSVPRILVPIEIDRALAGLKDGLEAKGVKVAPKFAVYDGDPDKTEPIREPGKLEKAISADLKKKLKTPAQKLAFAELCYDSSERQDWLLKLAGA